MNKSLEYTQSGPWFKYEVLAVKGDRELLKEGVFLDITCHEGRFHISWLHPVPFKDFTLVEFGGGAKQLKFKQWAANLNIRWLAKIAMPFLMLFGVP